ncbi:MAG: hypothetical protein OZSIB_0098 [Candidatus Ozemobacter sibiricus]|uniref:Uncharacterized protein n=1 Tax=Candidatus Ozemobacter sibiricus TaxID=2268124 RepID=A0A367ZMV5_9BACT|nr:MAG: hypothetical protein OZSIB_0098 [Candidatus Ozemobacter sibiricus]
MLPLVVLVLSLAAGFPCSAADPHTTSFLQELQDGAVTLNLEFFSRHALAEAKKVFGADGIIEDSVRLFFIDGAASLDLPPCFDLASVLCVMKLKEGYPGSPDLQLAFRLRLQGTTDFVLLKDPKANPSVQIFYPGQGIVTLVESCPMKKMQEIVEAMQKAIPQGTFGALTSLQIITYRVATENVPQVMPILANYSQFIDAHEVDGEVYPVPFAFDNPRLLPDRGRIRPDHYRTITAQLKKEGIPFTTETTIPPEFR